MDIIKILDQETIDRISSVLCNARFELECLAECMEDAETERKKGIECEKFDHYEIQEIADTLSIIEDWFFVHSSDNI